MTPGSSSGGIIGSSTTVTVLLPEPAPQGYKWYKYSSSQGWYDYSTNVTFNGDRTRLTITLIDGGTGDDDGQQNGIIEDPSGLGTAPAGSVSSEEQAAAKHATEVASRASHPEIRRIMVPS